MQFNNRKRLLVIVFGLASLIPFLLMFAAHHFDLFHSVTEQEVAQAKNYCEALKVPESFIMTGGHEVVKSNAAVFSEQFQSRQSLSEIEQFFENELTPLGWEHTLEAMNGISTVRFEREQYSISIESVDPVFGEERSFSISCSVGLR
ncbi:MAG: hypothetical protein ABI791_05570 [Acidobacteriota bacterium]